MKTPVIILLALSTFISCRPVRDLSFEVMSPASVNLPDLKAKYLILNSSYLPDNISDPANYISYLSSEDKIIVDTIIITSIFDGFYSVLEESPVAVLNNAEYLEIRTNDTTGFLSPLSPAAVSEICRDYNSDYLISFEYYSFDFQYNYHYGSSYESLELKWKLFWRIYSDDGKIIDDHISEGTPYWNNSINVYFDQNNVYSSNLDFIREAFRIAGTGYGKRISPHWENVSRLLYQIREKTDSGYITISMDKNRLQKRSMLENRTKAYRACYNLSVLCESEGDIKNALVWIDRASDKKHNLHARNYNEILLNRQKIIETLNKQTGKGNLN